MLERLGHVPAVGEAVEHDGWRIEVTEMDRLRIATVGATAPLPRPTPPTSDDDPPATPGRIAAVNLGALVLTLVLLLANAFFVAVEFGLMTARRSRLEALADKGSGAAAIALDPEP